MRKILIPSSRRILPLYRIQNLKPFNLPIEPSEPKVATWTIRLDQSFLHVSITDILCWIILCCRGLSCILQDVKQRSWPPPTRCQQDPFPSCDKNVSRHCQMSPGRHNCPWLRSTELDGLDMFSGSTYIGNLSHVYFIFPWQFLLIHLFAQHLLRYIL